MLILVFCTFALLSHVTSMLVSKFVLSTGWCIIRLMTVEQGTEKDSSGFSLSHALPVTQWSLLAVCLFFSSGHW